MNILRLSFRLLMFCVLITAFSCQEKGMTPTHSFTDGFFKEINDEGTGNILYRSGKNQYEYDQVDKEYYKYTIKWIAEDQHKFINNFPNSKTDALTPGDIINVQLKNMTETGYDFDCTSKAWEGTFSGHLDKMSKDSVPPEFLKYLNLRIGLN